MVRTEIRDTCFDENKNKIKHVKAKRERCGGAGGGHEISAMR